MEVEKKDLAANQKQKRDERLKTSKIIQSGIDSWVQPRLNQVEPSEQATQVR